MRPFANTAKVGRLSSSIKSNIKDFENEEGKYKNIRNENISVLDYIEKYQTTRTSTNLAAKTSLWNSTLIELKRVTKDELKFFTRTSFSTPDYFENILRKDLKTANNPFESGLVVSLGASGFFTSFVLPYLPGPTAIRNTVGLLFLSLPFLYMGASTIFPTLALKASASMRSEGEKLSQRNRLCYHEAGHFLVGYLCGLPILEYSIDDEQGASLAIATPSITMSFNTPLSSPEQIGIIERSIGSLLAISMAGIVSESLLFNDCKGGKEDWPFALQMISSYEFAKYKVRENLRRTQVKLQAQSSSISQLSSQLLSQTQSQYQSSEISRSQQMERFEVREEELDEYLRGGVMKALVLLRLHRDSLDRVAAAMNEGKSVFEIIDILESR